MKNNAEFIDYFQSGNHLTKIKSIVSYGARKKMFEMFMTFANAGEKDVVLDIGVTPEIALPESNFFERLYPYTSNITMASIEDASNLEGIFKGAKFVQTEPGKALPFLDKQFDIVFCSAVLEHVGDYKEQAEFLAELVRVGRRVFLTTPNRKFPIEFHTYLPLIHWFPRKIHQKLLTLIGMRFWAKTENLNLLDSKTLLSILPNQPTNQPTNHRRVSLLKNKLLGITSNLILYIEDI